MAIRITEDRWKQIATQIINIVENGRDYGTDKYTIDKLGEYLTTTEGIIDLIKWKHTTKEEMRRLKEGDFFYIDGFRHEASCDAHTLGTDGYEDEWVIYDENDASWFEEDFM